MVTDSMLVLCPRYKVSAIFAQFLFPATAGRRISPYIIYYHFGGSRAGERARGVPFLSVCSPGARAERALRASQKWEFPLPGKFWRFQKKNKTVLQMSHRMGYQIFQTPFMEAWSLDTEISNSPGLPDHQCNPWVGLDLVFCTQCEFIFINLVFAVPDHKKVMDKN